MLEVFAELSRMCILNLPNVRLTNQSFIISSIVAGFIISADLLFPFIMMRIMENNYKRIKSTKFDSKYGSIVEGVDINCDDAYKANYYVVFAGQRLIFVTVLVVLYQDPKAQCLSFIALHIAMMV